MKTICVFRALLLFGIFPAGIFAQGPSAFSVPRSEVVSSLEGKTTINPRDTTLSASQRNSTLALAKAQLQKQASEVLPDPVPAPSRQIMEFATSAPLNIAYRDDEYIRAAVRLDLYAVSMHIRYLERFPPLDDQQKIEIRSSLKKAASAIQREMESELIPLNVDQLTKQSIDEAVSNELAGLVEHVGGNPFQSQLMKPLSDADIDAITAEFGNRLRDSLPLVPKEVEKRAGPSPVGAQRNSAVAGLLREIAKSAIGAIVSRTTDQQRKGYDITKSAPAGYEQAAADYAKAVQRLTNDDDSTTSTDQPQAK